MNLPGTLWQALYARLQDHWRLAFGSVLLAAAAACMDGYPTQDTPAVDPFEMTQEQRLAQMNALGIEAHPERQWNYELLPGCVLRIDVDGKDGPRPSFDIPLLGAGVNLATDKADETFDVDLAPSGAGRRLPSVSVLEAESWAHASFMQLLLKVLQKGCLESEQAP